MLDLGLSIGSVATFGGSRLLYPGLDVALDFKNGIYEAANVRYATLASLPGYAFTDNVDNVPNFDANGYRSLTAEVSKLSATVNPITSDQDFIWWAVVGVPAASGGYEMFLAMNGGNGEYLSRRAGPVLAWGSNAREITSAALVAGSGRIAILGRRRSSKDTLAYKNPAGTVVVETEGSVNVLAAPSSTLNIGFWWAGSPLQPNASIEFVGIRRGTFDDTALTTLLTVA